MLNSCLVYKILGASIYCWDERLTFCVNFSRQRWAKLIPQMTESNISPDIISETIQQQTRYVYFFLHSNS